MPRRLFAACLCLGLALAPLVARADAFTEACTPDVPGRWCLTMRVDATTFYPEVCPRNPCIASIRGTASGSIVYRGVNGTISAIWREEFIEGLVFWSVTCNDVGDAVGQADLEMHLTTRSFFPTTGPIEELQIDIEQTLTFGLRGEMNRVAAGTPLGVSPRASMRVHIVETVPPDENFETDQMPVLGGAQRELEEFADEGCGEFHADDVTTTFLYRDLRAA